MIVQRNFSLEAQRTARRRSVPSQAARGERNAAFTIKRGLRGGGWWGGGDFNVFLDLKLRRKENDS